ncbi:MAG: hypothetical protein PUK40_07840 [Actinomycetaceae bacterium]|nr:hypothetical protein [Arcanobacterium sp.]MDD7505833.1 hypothetical protein [Actinomycetaceae bacterium]MDY6142856.1 hypothetical protein [Arcanobacterium sp.]
MDRTVRIVGVLLGMVIMGVVLLRAVQLENMLPLGSNDVGYINFQHSQLTDEEIDDGLAAIGDAHDIELYQLSGTVGTKEVTIISRGVDQPNDRTQVPWFRPGKTGVLIPAAASPYDSRSGIYAVKASTQSRLELERWLDSVGAVHTWERFTLLQTYFLPLAYQGVILILVVTVFLVTAVIFGWFIERAESRVIRMTAGQTKTRIVFDDTFSLLTLFVPPSFATLLVCILVLFVAKGVAAAQLVIPSLVIALLAATLMMVAVTIVSMLTFPRVADWVGRRPLVAAFSGVSTLICTMALVLSIVVLPVVYHSYMTFLDNREAADQALQLPPYYSVSFGGIVDEARDYDPFVRPFADLVSSLDSSNRVGLFFSTDTESSDVLQHEGFQNLVIVNPLAMEGLSEINGGCKFREIEQQAIGQNVAEETASLGMLNQNALSQLRFYVCSEGSRVIAIRYQGIFALAPNSLIVLIPSIDGIVDADTVTSWATVGAVLFTDPESVVGPACEIGLNFTTDRTIDTVSAYAEDQQLGYMVSLASLGCLVVAAIISIFVNASVYAASRADRMFLRYVAGYSVSRLVAPRAALDVVFAAASVIATSIIAALLGISMPTLPMCAVVLGIVVASVGIRALVMKRHLVAVSQRKD